MGEPVNGKRLERPLANLELIQIGEQPKPRHDQEVLYDQWGLLDYKMFESYRDPATYPENSTPWYLNGSGWDFHHMLYSKGKYKKHDDQRIVWLRGGSYFQVPLQREMHDLYHWDHTKDVDDTKIDIRSAERFLDEAKLLSTFGMATLMVRETIRIKDETRKLSKKDKMRLSAQLAIFNTIRHEAEDRIRDIEVMPQGVVNYAVAGYSTYAQPEQSSIKDIIESGNGLAMMPVRLRPPSGLKEMGKVALNARVKKMNWAVKKIFEQETAVAA